MRITSVELFNYIPLLHCGTKRIKVNVNANTLIVIGTNGCGKSSLFRELTPYPANRTDYEKNGYKRLTIEHDKSTFELESDFSKASKAHSFIKDGEELNESGTNATQIDLCNTYFGLNEVIDTLINLGYHICDMGRADRKNLFMSTYPNSMSFILEYHKKVCYQLRDFAASIKAFNERKLILEEKILSENERHRLAALLKKYQNLNVEIDRQIFALTQKIELLETLPEYTSEDTNKIKAQIEQIGVETFLKNIDASVKLELHALTRFKRKNKWYQNKNTLGNFASTLNKEAHGFGELKWGVQKEIEAVCSEIKELKEQLDQYEQSKSVDLEAEIKHLQEHLKTLNSQYEENSRTIANRTFPKVANRDELLDMNNRLLARIRGMLSEIFHSTVIWSPAKVEQKKQHLWHLNLEIDNNKKHLDVLIDQLKELKRQSSIVEKIDPNCVSRVCKLRERVEQKLKETNTQMNLVIEQGKRLREATNKKEKEYQEGTVELSGPLDVNEYVIKVIEEIHQAGLSDYMCGGKWDIDVFIDQLNNNPSAVLDKINSFSELNAAYLTCKELSQDIQISKKELDTLINIHLPTKNLIVKTISEKKLKHEMLLKKLDELDKKICEYESKETELYSATSSVANLESTGSRLTQFCKYYSIQAQIDQASELLDFFNKSKIKITSSLLEIETIVKEQESLLVRLNDEILPSIKHYESEHLKWSIVEKGLNPNSGIPHRYMIAYINALIDIVNRIIKNVWVYDMEILPLKEDNELNYSFQFTVNNGEPIKDINLASKGQKEIMDLAWVLAIFHQMKLGKSYPLKLDEPDGGLNNEHRVRLLNFLQQMMQNEDLGQLFMINQFPSVYDSFISSQTLCIKEEGILLPAEYNQDIEIDRV